MKAIERIKEIQGINEDQFGGNLEQMALYLWTNGDIVFLLKAFKVMREIAVELQNMNLYRQFLSGNGDREILKDSERHIDLSFEMSMMRKNGE